MKHILPLMLLFFTQPAIAATLDLVVTARQTDIRVAPSSDARRVASVGRGRHLKSDGTVTNGFYLLLTKSGKTFWIAQKDVRLESDAEADLLGNEKGKPSPSSPTPADTRAQEDFDRLTYDLGLAAGTSGEISYTEVYFGISYFFVRWMAWRNSLFGRFASNIESLYGLDSSLRAVLSTRMGPSSRFTLFGGPGYRFVNEGRNVPLGELGVILKLGGLSLGGGAKTLFYQMIDKDLENDTQYFLILSGSGAF